MSSFRGLLAPLILPCYSYEPSEYWNYNVDTVALFSGLFSTENITGVFIPSVLLVVGTAIAKTEWVPFAVAVAAVLSGLKVFSNRMWSQCSSASHPRLLLRRIVS